MSHITITVFWVKKSCDLDEYEMVRVSFVVDVQFARDTETAVPLYRTKRCHSDHKHVISIFTAAKTSNFTPHINNVSGSLLKRTCLQIDFSVSFLCLFVSYCLSLYSSLVLFLFHYLLHYLIRTSN
jgi:hypothetical protein